MKTSRQFNIVWITIPFAVLITLLLRPATRFIVWSQLKLLVPTEGNVAPFYSTDFMGPGPTAAVLMRHEADRHPEDYNVQLAIALLDPRRTNTPLDYVAPIRTIGLRFPNNPSLLANTLRIACTSVIVRRPGPEELGGKRDSGGKFKVRETAPRPPDPQLIAIYLDAAKSGERLDPNNACFPVFEAIGLFALNRDQEAMKAIESLSSKNQWNDYSEDAVDAEAGLYKATFGGMLALPDHEIREGVLYPHLAQLREVARLGTAEAIKRERSGDKTGGMRIRQALTHCGELMRVQSRSMIGSLVGLAITSISWTRPGGAVPSAAESKLTTEQRSQNRFEAYCSYLRTLGLSAYIPNIVFDHSADTKVRDIAKANESTYLDNVDILQFGDIMAWLFSMVILNAAAWVLALGAAGAVVEHLRSRRKHPLPRLLRSLESTAYACVIVWLYWFQANRCFSAVVKSSGLFSGPEIVPNGIRTVGVAAGAAIPLLVVLVVGVVGLIKKYPLSSGLRARAPQIAAIILLGYFRAASITARDEALIIRRLDASHVHEGQYYARQMHKSWPGMRP